MQPRIAAVQKVMSKEGEINKRNLAECKQNPVAFVMSSKFSSVLIIGVK